MLVMRKQYFGLGTALSNRKSVHPSVKIVSSPSSSATGPSAGVLALEMTPVNRLTLASVPAASSAVMVSILRLPNKPPWALISSAAMVWPLNDGSPSTAAALVRNVMWPVLKGVSGIFPLAGSWAALSSCEPPTRPAPARPAPPTVTPNVLRKARRFTVGVFSMNVLPFGQRIVSLATRRGGRDTTSSYPRGTAAILRAGQGKPQGREPIGAIGRGRSRSHHAWPAMRACDPLKFSPFQLFALLFAKKRPRRAGPARFTIKRRGRREIPGDRGKCPRAYCRLDFADKPMNGRKPRWRF